MAYNAINRSKSQIEVENLKKVQSELNLTYGMLMRPQLLKTLRPVARIFQKEIRKRAPKRKKYLVRASKVGTFKGKNDKSYASVFVDFDYATYPYRGEMVQPFYAIMVHNGTTTDYRGRRIRGGATTTSSRVRIKPNPFVYEAFISVAPEAADTALTNLIKLIEK